MGQSVLSELVTQYAEEGVCMWHVLRFAGARLRVRWWRDVCVMYRNCAICKCSAALLSKRESG